MSLMLWRPVFRVPVCVRASSLCYGVQSVLGRLVCARASSLCYGVQSVLGRPVCVRASSLC